MLLTRLPMHMDAGFAALSQIWWAGTWREESFV
jgi:hypothetical protein